MAKKKSPAKTRSSVKKKKNDAILKRAAVVLAIVLALAMLAGPVLGSCTRQQPSGPSGNVSVPATTSPSGNLSASP